MFWKDNWIIRSLFFCYGTHELTSFGYGVRFYDAEIGRWNVVDPMVDSYHSYSPYNYALNTPIGKLDPNGMWVENADSWTTNDKEEIAAFMQQRQGNEQEDRPKDPPVKGYWNSFRKATIDYAPFDRAGKTFTKWLGEGPSAVLDDLGGVAGNFIYRVGSLFFAETYVNDYNNFRNYLNAPPEEKGAADGAAVSSLVEGAVTYAPLGMYGRQALTFQVNEGYGIFGLNGFKLGNYSINLFYGNRTPGSGTYLSIKQNVQSGALYRWYYGTIHRTNIMLPHSIIRFHFNGKQYGNTQQRTFLPSSLKAPFFREIK